MVVVCDNSSCTNSTQTSLDSDQAQRVKKERCNSRGVGQCHRSVIPLWTAGHKSNVIYWVLTSWVTGTAIPFWAEPISENPGWTRRSRYSTHNRNVHKNVIIMFCINKMTNVILFIQHIIIVFDDLQITATALY